MSSSSSNSSSCYRGFKKFRTTVESGVECDCGLEAPCWEAWKDSTADPGRRFFGCSRYKIPRLKCNFFKWADPPYTERSREVIETMKLKLTHKNDEVMILRHDLDYCHKRMRELKEELADTKVKLTYHVMEKEEKYMKMKKLVMMIGVGAVLCLGHLVYYCMG